MGNQWFRFLHLKRCLVISLTIDFTHLKTDILPPIMWFVRNAPQYTGFGSWFTSKLFGSAGFLIIVDKTPLNTIVEHKLMITTEYAIFGKTNEIGELKTEMKFWIKLIDTSLIDDPDNQVTFQNSIRIAGMILCWENGALIRRCCLKHTQFMKIVLISWTQISWTELKMHMKKNGLRQFILQFSFGQFRCRNVFLHTFGLEMNKNCLLRQMNEFGLKKRIWQATGARNRPESKLFWTQTDQFNWHRGLLFGKITSMFNVCTPLVQINK